jgi:bifunctional DNase/RNase
MIHAVRRASPPVLLLAGLVSGCAGDEGAADGMVAVEVVTVTLDPASQAPVVLLRDPETGQVLPIWVGLPEAQAITRALHGLTTPRPMTHDLLATLVRDLSAEVTEVQVHELRGETFHGRIRLRVRGGRMHDLDSRPSDAMALALRVGAPIRVPRALLGDPPEADLLAPEGDAEAVPGFGLTVVTPTPELRRTFRLPDHDGVMIARVTGAAEAAGLRRGDLVIRVNEDPVRSPVDVIRAALDAPAGAVLRVRYWRGGREADVELSPAEPGADRPRGALTEA